MHTPDTFMCTNIIIVITAAPNALSVYQCQPTDIFINVWASFLNGIDPSGIADKSWNILMSDNRVASL